MCMQLSELFVPRPAVSYLSVGPAAYEALIQKALEEDFVEIVDAGVEAMKKAHLPFSPKVAYRCVLFFFFFSWSCLIKQSTHEILFRGSLLEQPPSQIYGVTSSD